MATGNFWHDLLPHEPPNVTYENRSIDVFEKDCFASFDKTACVRSSVLTFLGFFTFIPCVVRIVRLHIFQHPLCYQYCIFYAALIEVAILIVKWFKLMSLYQIEFLASFLKMIQFCLILHFYWTLVSRILHQQWLINWIIMPILSLLFAGFTLITVLGFLTRFSTWDECLAPHWVLLSFIEFLSIQVFLIAGYYITKNINVTSSEESFRLEQKVELWSVIVAYELSSIISLAYYLTLQLLGHPETGCSGIFGHSQEMYSPVYVIVMVMKYLVPIWIMLLNFGYTRGNITSEHARLLGLYGDGPTTSVFSTEGSFQDSHNEIKSQDSIGKVYTGMRRSVSTPGFFTKSLSSISEDGIHVPTQVLIPNYGATESCSPEAVAFIRPGTRSRHDSGMPPRNVKGKRIKVVSLNQCSDEMESVTPSSGERA